MACLVGGEESGARQRRPWRILVEAEIGGAIVLARIVLERHVAQEVEAEAVDQFASRRVNAREPNRPIGFRTLWQSAWHTTDSKDSAENGRRE